ncbi:putative prophage PSSB64-01, Orf24 [Pseudomonas sp. StFLB209]|uniref:putative phage tail assembly chaperone n=1 Tax=Pseudomonas sp. StFLB209 TaxID=1028989 RepID=UPI0004F85FDF|nr:putative phage tail assembly chaperone [Pseudomonas sp. StFLB209]BAP41295.1 putative prophage PSSB64-01, Orf24 [Pseudomonas sp. StFLB209]
MSEANRTITLEFGTSEFSFTFTPADITKYFNSTTQNNKVAPAHNLLISTVQPEQKEALKAILANPVHTMSLTGALVEEYAPDLGVIVKKPSTTRLH